MESYTYKIKNIDITNATILVNFIPDDARLTPVVVNTYIYEKPYTDIKNENGDLVYADQDAVPFSVHLENTLEVSAPQDLWRRQKKLIDNFSLVNALPKE